MRKAHILTKIWLTGWAIQCWLYSMCSSESSHPLCVCFCPGSFKAGDEGTILKKFSENEKLCFERLKEDALHSFVPGYYGVVERDGELFLKMKDLLANFDLPNVMDCKMGVRYSDWITDALLHGHMLLRLILSFFLAKLKCLTLLLTFTSLFSVSFVNSLILYFFMNFYILVYKLLIFLYAQT